jgi:hypothetical protein
MREFESHSCQNVFFAPIHQRHGDVAPLITASFAGQSQYAMENARRGEMFQQFTVTLRKTKFVTGYYQHCFRNSFNSQLHHCFLRALLSVIAGITPSLSSCPNSLLPKLPPKSIANATPRKQQ